MAELNTLAPMKWSANFNGTTPTLDSSNNVNVGDFAIDTSTTPNLQWQCLKNTLGSPMWVQTSVSVSGALVASGFAYRSATYSMTGTGDWENIPMTGGDNNLVNVSHSTGANPERLTVAVAGTYAITYRLSVLRNGTSHHVASRLFKNGTTEIAGSWAMEAVVTSDVNDTRVLTATVIATLAAGDYVTAQASINVASTPEIGYYASTPPAAPTTYVTGSIGLYTINASSYDALVANMSGSDNGKVLVANTTAFDSYTAALYHFNSDFSDSSVNGATLSNSATGYSISSTAKFGAGSVLFSGGRLVQPLGNDFSGQYTVEAYIYPTSNSTSILWHTNTWNGSPFLGIQFNNNHWTAQSNGLRESSTTATTNVWTHLALTRDGAGNCNMWINGTSVLNWTDTTNYGVAGVYPWYLGNGVNTSYPFAGYIDELRISSTCRYTSAFTPTSVAFSGSTKAVGLAGAAINTPLSSLTSASNGMPVCAS